ncbi:MAG: dTMP kinase [Acidimicrobiia bacterium]
MTRGRYVALEGIEGAGKSTVAASLVDRLTDRGMPVVAVREPGGTALGEEIRRMLLHAGDMSPWAEALLFAAQRAQLAAEVVGPALDRGRWVVSDRSYYSSLAYQGAARGLGVDAVRGVNEAGLQGVVPDLVIVLDVEPSIGLRRQAVPDRIGGEGEGFQRAVAAAFRSLAASEPDRVVLVDAAAPRDVVVDSVMARVEGRWSS